MSLEDAYAALFRLSGKSLQQGKDLFVLAGRLGRVPADGGNYFFEKQSADALNAFCKVNVADESDRVVGTIDAVFLFFSYVQCGDDRRFDPSKHQYHLVDPPTTDDEAYALWLIREQLLADLRERGREAAEMMETIGSLIGGVPPSRDDFGEILAKHLH